MPQKNQLFYREKPCHDERGFGFAIEFIRFREQDGQPVVTASTSPSHRWPVREASRRAAARSIQAVKDTGMFPNWCDPKICEELGRE